MEHKNPERHWIRYIYSTTTTIVPQLVLMNYTSTDLKVTLFMIFLNSVNLHQSIQTRTCFQINISYLKQWNEFLALEIYAALRFLYFRIKIICNQILTGKNHFIKRFQGSIVVPKQNAKQIIQDNKDSSNLIFWKTLMFVSIIKLSFFGTIKKVTHLSPEFCGSKIHQMHKYYY